MQEHKCKRIVIMAVDHYVQPATQPSASHTTFSQPHNLQPHNLQPASFSTKCLLIGQENLIIPH